LLIEALRWRFSRGTAKSCNRCRIQATQQCSNMMFAFCSGPRYRASLPPETIPKGGINDEAEGR